MLGRDYAYSSDQIICSHDNFGGIQVRPSSEMVGAAPCTAHERATDARLVGLRRRPKYIVCKAARR